MVPELLRDDRRAVQLRLRNTQHQDRLQRLACAAAADGGCDRERTAQGKKSNKEIVELAAPLSFGRQTRVFDLPRRQFAFGRDFHSPYRIPFFFVEDRVVKLYFLQPRKTCGLNFDELGMVAAIYKNYLLDTEFFGQAADVEFIDLSAVTGTTVRAVRNYALNDSGAVVGDASCGSPDPDRRSARLPEHA